MNKAKQKINQEKARAECNIDVVVAKDIMGWREIQAPQYDYDGPLPEQGMVLVPPTFNADEYRFWPNRGVVPYNYFVTQEYSKDMNQAMKVVSILAASGYQLFLKTETFGASLLYSATFSKSEKSGRRTTKNAASSNPAMAICMAAVGLKLLLKKKFEKKDL